MKKITNLILAVAVIMTLQNTTNANKSKYCKTSKNYDRRSR